MAFSSTPPSLPRGRPPSSSSSPSSSLSKQQQQHQQQQQNYKFSSDVMERVSLLSDSQLRSLFEYMSLSHPNLLREAMEGFFKLPSQVQSPTEKPQPSPKLQQQQQQQQQALVEKSVEKKSPPTASAVMETLEATRRRAEEVAKVLAEEEAADSGLEDNDNENDNDDHQEDEEVSAISPSSMAKPPLSVVVNHEEVEVANNHEHNQQHQHQHNNGSASISTPVTSNHSVGSEDGCYLVYDPSSNGRLMLHYSRTRVAGAVGFWSPPADKPLAKFKYDRHQGRSVLIGGIQGGVVGRRNYYGGWCQFVRAARAVGGELTVFSNQQGQGLPVDLYGYYFTGQNAGETHRIRPGVPTPTAPMDAVTCLPAKSTLFRDDGAEDLWDDDTDASAPSSHTMARMDLTHWMTITDKVGAATSFATATSPSSRPHTPLGSRPRHRTRSFSPAPRIRPPLKPSVAVGGVSTVPSRSSSPMLWQQHAHVQTTSSSSLPPYSSGGSSLTPLRNRADSDDDCSVASVGTTNGGSANPGACFLVYDPNGARLVQHYLRPQAFATVQDTALGSWKAGPGKRIQSFKYKKNFGRFDLQSNCASGVQGRKNYYSGWCQFLRAARALDGSVRVHDRGHRPGLDVDLYAYCELSGAADHTEQTRKLTPDHDFDLSQIQAVACLPRHADFYEPNLRIALNHWMTTANTVGAATRFDGM